MVVSIRAEGLKFSIGEREILSDVNFVVKDNEKVGLVGVNGAGKTTLFKLILGEYKPDAGRVDIKPCMSILHMEQIVESDSNKTILEEALDSYSDLIAMEEDILRLEQSMGEERDEDKLHVYINAHDNLLNKFKDRGGYEYFSRARGILKGLGFSESDYNRRVSTLSGGQKTRLRLAKLLTKEPDVLLLDEPTNHLDIDSIEWLERFINGYSKSIVVISHDRFFLDQTVSKIIEIENAKATTYDGNYSEYVKKKEIDRDIQRRHYDNQQKEIARLESFIQQQRQWNRQRNIIAARSRQKAIDRMDKVDEPSKLPDRVKFKFSVRRNSGNDVLSVNNVSMAYPGVDLFCDVSFKVMKGERVFLLGDNGVGKSTMLKIILGEVVPKSGSVSLGTNVDVDYYSQELTGLSDTNTIYEEVLDATDGLTNTDIRNALASFLFCGDSVNKEIASLSGGEKGKVALCKIMLHRANFLLLDEPTNHLDINSKEVFEEVLKNYEGTLFIISHDRYFIDKLATRVIELTHDGILDVRGNYSFYKNYKSGSVVKEEGVKKNLSRAKEDYENAKEEKRMRQKLEREILKCEEKIARLEEEIDNIEKEMMIPEISTDYIKLEELGDKQCALREELEAEYSKWEELSLKFE